MTAPAPPHDVAWFLRERLPELAKMGTWCADTCIRLKDAGGYSCCPISAPHTTFVWRARAFELGLSDEAQLAIVAAADNYFNYDPTIRAALLAGLGLKERAR